ncbi:MAG: serine hydrolase domain-containing protein [Thermomicrobiales bacterium]
MWDGLANLSRGREPAEASEDWRRSWFVASDPSRIADAWQRILDGTERDAYSGAVALVARRTEVVLHRATGFAVKAPAQIRMTEETIFDLASLTKVVATLPSILRLVESGKVGLDEPVGARLPEFGVAGWKRGVTIRRLLSHSAGFPAWRPFYVDGVGPASYLATIASVEPAYEPGAESIYSDFGFILLGELVRRVTGDEIAEFAAREVFAPLGMTETMFTPPAALRDRIAATEIGNPYERGMAGERAAEFGGWRVGSIHGEVHDGNAYYGLKGVAGHAGLFGTARDLLRYGQCWLRGGIVDGMRLLSDAIVAEATSEQAPGRGLGWRLPTDDPEDHGRPLDPRAYGHTGFTGTSLWIDPERELVIVLLTNRVHPTVREGIGAVRLAFNAALADAFTIEGSEESA